MTKLNILEDELKSLQKNLDDVKEQLKHKKRQLNMARENATEHDNKYKSACEENKEIK